MVWFMKWESIANWKTSWSVSKGWSEVAMSGSFISWRIKLKYKHLDMNMLLLDKLMEVKYQIVVVVVVIYIPPIWLGCPITFTIRRRVSLAEHPKTSMWLGSIRKRILGQVDPNPPFKVI